MKNAFKTIFLLSALTITTSALAQQQVMFTQYMFNQLAINPAYAGIHEGISTSMLWREQWVGFEGAPSTQTISVHSPLNYRPASLGLVLMRDKIGITTQHGAYASYAYRIRFEKSQLSMGMQGSITQYQTDYSEEAGLDPILANANVNVMRPNFGAGLMWHSDRHYVGLSVPQLMNQSFDPGNLDSDSELVRHYFLLAGYVFDINNDLKFKPNILVKHVAGAPTQVDLNANFLIKDVVWVGLSYRSLDSFDFLFQLQINPQLQIGYAFDFATTTELRRVNAGSHEFMLNYIFELPRKKVLTPRYF
ncbi:MAG: type IX secretion system membrane protein PorP/SprF [Cyclobacteriaceae bacterium]